LMDTTSSFRFIRFPSSLFFIAIVVSSVFSPRHTGPEVAVSAAFIWNVYRVLEISY
jgi:hypothetical protein